MTRIIYVCALVLVTLSAGVVTEIHDLRAHDSLVGDNVSLGHSIERQRFRFTPPPFEAWHSALRCHARP
jgi:hypothetical protein